MFHLYTSNRTEKLAERLAGVVAGDKAVSLFTPELFLIQSRGMELMLSHFLADVFGVWCNAVYLLPVQFISYLSKTIGIDAQAQCFEREVLTWRLEQLLRDTSEPDLGPLDVYLSGEQADLKRFQLARKLANLFDQYQIMRPDYLAGWRRGELATDDSSELWQRRLWLNMLEEYPEAMHRGEVLEQLGAVLAQGGAVERLLPDRIFVFGLHTMPPLFLQALNALSRVAEVHLFLSSPCRLYWGDLESRRARAKRRLRGIERGIPAEPPELDHHPLLASLGRQGSDFQELLLDVVPFYNEGPDMFVGPLEEGDESLLQRLQADILDGRAPPSPGQGLTIEPDGSIVAVSCHSRMREMMVLKDYLLSWLYEDPDLDLHDIVVMAPDIQEYAQLIPAVFDTIQHSIADRQAHRKNPCIAAFMEFIRLFRGRFGWSEVLSLLEKPEIYPQFDLSSGDLGQLRHWVVASGIRWGLSAEQRGSDGMFEFASGSWKAGLDRMLMGLAISCEEPVDNILPYTDIEGGQAPVLGGLWLFISSLEEMWGRFRRPKTLDRWVVLLHRCSTILFGAAERPELLELQQMITSLGETVSEFHQQPVSAEVVLAWFQVAAETTTTAGFLSGRLTFCSMLPMRSIPFKVICLLGINDGVFPKNDNFATFDLLGKDYRPGDRSSRADDRYQFLEAIMSARTRLYVSFTGQSIRTNKRIPPSVVITELLEVLELYYGVRDLVVSHPLQPSNSAYFSGGELFSYDGYQARIASALHRKEHGPAEGWLHSSLETEAEELVELQELSRFLNHPQAYFVRDIMGVNLNDKNVFPEDHEPFELGALERYATAQVAVEALLQGAGRQDIIDRLQAEQRWPLATPGRYRFERQVDDFEAFASTIRASTPGRRLPGLPVKASVGGCRLIGELDHLYEGGQLFYRYGDLKGKDVLRAWLHHLIAGRVLEENVTTTVICRDMSIVITRDLGSAADLVFLLQLFAAGRPQPSPLFVEPAFGYALQERSNRGRGRKAPLLRARERYQRSIENGYEPEWRLLFGEQPAERILNEPFEALCRGFMVPLWDMILDASEAAGHG